ncbi:serine/arginine repetitive matrix protein 1-like protein, partial [Leptotrombidium deliense]
MTDAGFFRGTSAEQDNRFADKQKKLLKQLKFADNLTSKVDMSKVNIEVIKPWITRRISEILGMEDDVVESFVLNQLDEQKCPDGKLMQINLTGFLEGRNARVFMGELWDLLLSAQKSADGIPPILVELKKEELRKKQEEDEERKKLEAEEKLRNGSNKVKESPNERRRSRSPRKSVPRTPTPRKQSRSPIRRRRSRSRSPSNRRQSRSPIRRRRNSSPRRNTRSPIRRGSPSRVIRKSVSQSPSPRKQSRSPVRKRRSRSQSPSPQKQSRSP